MMLLSSIENTLLLVIQIQRTPKFWESQMINYNLLVMRNLCVRSNHSGEKYQFVVCPNLILLVMMVSDIVSSSSSCYYYASTGAVAFNLCSPITYNLHGRREK